MERKSLRKESERLKKQKAKTVVGIRGINTPVMRSTNGIGEEKILLRCKVKTYDIVYRRVKFVNELVINGQIYDEKKALKSV